MVERSKKEKMTSAQSQPGLEVGEVVTWDGMPKGRAFIFKALPDPNSTQKFGDKESCK